MTRLGTLSYLVYNIFFIITTFQMLADQMAVCIYFYGYPLHSALQN